MDLDEGGSIVIGIGAGAGSAKIVLINGHLLGVGLTKVGSACRDSICDTPD